MTDCEELLRPAILGVLEDTIRIESEADGCRVIVPFERSDNDAISLKVIEERDRYVVTDESETYGMLFLSNIDLSQERRRRRLESVRERYHLEQAEQEIRLFASEDDLGQRIIDAIQAVQSISHLVQTRQQYTTSDFHSEVGDYLSDHDLHYERNAEVAGAVDTHRVDFSIHNGQPTYLQALHAESASSAHGMAVRTMWKWTDIKEAVSDVVRISVLDDSGAYDDRTVRILEGYSDYYVPWSDRQAVLDIV